MEEENKNPVETNEPTLVDAQMSDKPPARDPNASKPKKPNSFKDFFNRYKNLIVLAVILLVAAGVGVVVLGSDSEPEEPEPVPEVVEEPEPVVERPFENKILYAYYEDGLTVIRTIDLDDNSKETLQEIGEKETLSTDVPYEEKSAYVDISDNKQELLYVGSSGIHTSDINGENKKTIVSTAYVRGASAVGEANLQSATINGGTGSIEADAGELSYQYLEMPVFGAGNTIGLIAKQTNGSTAELIDLSTKTLLDIGNATSEDYEDTNVDGAGEIGFSKRLGSDALISAQLYPARTFQVLDGFLYNAAYSSDGTVVGVLAGPETDENGAKTVYLLDPNTLDFEEVETLGIGTLSIFGGTNFYVIERANFQASAPFIFKEYSKSGEVVRSIDVTDLAGISGDADSIEVYEIAGKVYLVINTKDGLDYKTHVYDLDEKDVLVELNIGKESNFQLLDRY